MMWIRFFTYIFIALFLSACISVPPLVGTKRNQQKTESLPPPPSPQEQAQRLAEQGNYTEAANAYFKLAQTGNPALQPTYTLLAAENLVKAKKFTEAKQAINQLTITPQNPHYLRLSFINIAIALHEKRLDSAQQMLQAINVMQLQQADQLQHRLLSIELLAAQGQQLEALNARIEIDNHLSPLTKRENHEKIWAQLSPLSIQTLQTLPKSNHIDFAGWVELSILAQSAHPNRLQQAIDYWQTQHPTHPAKQDIMLSLLQNNQAIAEKQQQIAVLLPLNSKYKHQAKAIQDGMMSAFYSQQVDRPKIQFYDVNADNVSQQYQQAVYAGADYVVGPLMKDNIQRLVAARNYLPVPTLALNIMPETTAVKNLYQFSLSPEDEARNVVARAWQDGRRAAVILAPESAWGQRVAKAFYTLWQQQGGQVLASSFYQNDLNTGVKQVLNQGGRHADMLFLLAKPVVARQFQPILKYNGASNLAVYSISRVYSGRPDPQLDRDINGIVFCDMPWMLSPDLAGRTLQESIKQTQPRQFDSLKRLYAFGVDAYDVLTQLARLQSQPYSRWQGQTGNLSLNTQQTIQRDLMWAKFVGGFPNLLDDVETNIPRQESVLAPAPAVPLIPAPAPAPIIPAPVQQ